MYITSDITNNCNARCGMCYFSLPGFKAKGRYMSPEEFGRIADKLSEYGGELSLSCSFEPLIHPQFVDFMPHLKKLRNWKVRLNTNGIGLNEKNIMAMIENELDDIIISLDAPTAELNNLIRGNKKFDHIIREIHRLQEIKAKLGVEKPICTIRLCILKANLHVLPDMVLLAKELGVTKLTSKHVLPMDGCTIDGMPIHEQSCLLCPEETEKVFARTKKLAEENNITFGLPSAYPKPDSALIRICKPLMNGFHIYPDMTCNPCVWLNHYPVCGNILDDDILTILKSKPITKLKRRFEKDDLPDECIACLKDLQTVGIKEDYKHLMTVNRFD